MLEVTAVDSIEGNLPTSIILTDLSSCIGSTAVCQYRVIRHELVGYLKRLIKVGILGTLKHDPHG